MAFKVQRRIIRLGTSRAIILPSSWCNYYAGKLDRVVILEDQVLVIAPAGLEGKALSPWRDLKLTSEIAKVRNQLGQMPKLSPISTRRDLPPRWTTIGVKSISMWPLRPIPGIRAVRCLKISGSRALMTTRRVSFKGSKTGSIDSVSR